MGFIIRTADASDAPAIARLSKYGLGYDYSVEKVEDKLKKLLKDTSHLILVAEFDERIIGFVHAQEYDVLYDDTLLNILGIAVDTQSRRAGAGRALMTAVEAHAKEKGFVGVRLNSGGTRKGAHAFYESCGYTDRKEQLRFIKYL